MLSFVQLIHLPITFLLVSQQSFALLVKDATSSVDGNLSITEKNRQCVLLSEKMEVYHQNVLVGKITLGLGRDS